ncbi:RNA polymerase sigma factor [Streptomyces sp. NPDC088846]|uniref:RNA polymerase sigma factor n=1 Tax=Streptomyces sp. NPDC088846 TaxID=3365908 RepID=UPI0037F35CB6
MAEPEAVTAETLGGVFEQCRGELTGKARQLLQDANVPPSVADADDIVSSAFATALRNPGVVRQPRAYLYKLIRTEIVHLATRRAEHYRLDEKRAADPLCSSFPDVADFSALVDNRDAVHRAVRELSVPQRTAVWATCALDYTRDETAVIMGKHPGTVARHSTRAMALLRASIAAVVVGVLTVLGLAVGGVLLRATPADAPRREPALRSAQWWSENWMVTVVAVIIGASVVWVLGRRDLRLTRRLVDAFYTLMQLIYMRGLALRQRIPGLQVRNTLPANLAMLCHNCHSRTSAKKLTPAEQNTLLWQAKFTPQAARQAASACQLCGQGDSLSAPLEVAHIVSVAELLPSTLQRMGRLNRMMDGPPKDPWADLDPTARNRLLRDAEPVSRRPSSTAAWLSESKTIPTRAVTLVHGVGEPTGWMNTPSSEARSAARL